MNSTVFIQMRSAGIYQTPTMCPALLSTMGKYKVEVWSLPLKLPSPGNKQYYFHFEANLSKRGPICFTKKSITLLVLTEIYTMLL